MVLLCWVTRNEENQLIKLNNILGCFEGNQNIISHLYFSKELKKHCSNGRESTINRAQDGSTYPS
jgi:hypothetical protein